MPVGDLIPLLGGAALLAPTFAKTSGSLRLTGLSAPVTVTRDGHGVPRIRADNEDSAFFVLGFVHGASVG